jgi:UDP-N-acetylmuramoylalanine--D-glutamate ligase
MEGDYRGRRVVILGMARQGIALARYLTDHRATVVVSDLRPAEELTHSLAQLTDVPVTTVLGGHPVSLLDGADLVCLSGGVPTDAPIVREANSRGIPITNDTQIFLERCPSPVIGITGSAGKTTTTALVGELCRLGLATADRRVWVGGNIGRSMLPDLAEIRPDDLVVMELSSFQLEILSQSPCMAAVLNLTPNHLDRHKTMERYAAAKARILEYQTETGIAVLGRDDAGAWSLRDRVRGRLRLFSAEAIVEPGAFVRDGRITVRNEKEEAAVCPIGEVRLRGGHNLLNLLAALALADAAEVSIPAMAEIARTFAGVEHRLELVRELNGVQWYDDSIATAPERMMAALRAFSEPIVLLVGGRDKDLPWSGAASLIAERVRDLVLFGEAAGLVHSHLDVSRLRTVAQVDSLEAAVETAARLARPGDVVLLSPGGTSFDAYRDYAERGDHFRALVQQL